MWISFDTFITSYSKRMDFSVLHIICIQMPSFLYRKLNVKHKSSLSSVKVTEMTCDWVKMNSLYGLVVDVLIWYGWYEPLICSHSDEYIHTFTLMPPARSSVFTSVWALALEERSFNYELLRRWVSPPEERNETRWGGENVRDLTAPDQNVRHCREAVFILSWCAQDIMGKTSWVK